MIRADLPALPALLKPACLPLPACGSSGCTAAHARVGSCPVRRAAGAWRSRMLSWRARCGMARWPSSGACHLPAAACCLPAFNCLLLAAARDAAPAATTSVASCEHGLIVPWRRIPSRVLFVLRHGDLTPPLPLAPPFRCAVLCRRAAAAGSVRRFILAAGGIHTTAEGLPCCGMDHNAAREAAIEEIKRECAVSAAGARAGSGGARSCRAHSRPAQTDAPCAALPLLPGLVGHPWLPCVPAVGGGGGITWTAVDSSVYFKDIGRQAFHKFRLNPQKDLVASAEQSASSGRSVLGACMHGTPHGPARHCSAKLVPAAKGRPLPYRCAAQVL